MKQSTHAAEYLTRFGHYLSYIHMSSIAVLPDIEHSVQKNFSVEIGVALSTLEMSLKGCRGHDGDW